MRTHMQLVPQRLGSDKTRTAVNGESDTEVRTYVYTREATAFLTTHDGDLAVIRPATFDKAPSRIQEANTRLRKTRAALQGSVKKLPQSDRECPPSPTAQTRVNMRAVIDHVRRDVGITVPPGVAAMYTHIQHGKAIRNAATIMRAPPEKNTTHATMITEILGGNYPPMHIPDSTQTRRSHSTPQ